MYYNLYQILTQSQISSYMQGMLRFLPKALQIDKMGQVILLEQKKKKNPQMILKAYR